MFEIHPYKTITISISSRRMHLLKPDAISGTRAERVFLTGNVYGQKHQSMSFR